LHKDKRVLNVLFHFGLVDAEVERSVDAWSDSFGRAERLVGERDVDGRGEKEKVVESSPNAVLRNVLEYLFGT
jgi:hypothetical protein